MPSTVRGSHVIDRSSVRFAASLSAGALAALTLLNPATGATAKAPKGSSSVQSAVVPSPRAVADIATILDSENSAERKITEGQAVADATPSTAKEEAAIAPNGASSVHPAFVPPPRTIADVTAILDGEKPDERKIAERRAAADAPPPARSSAAELAKFYYDRADARALLGRHKDAIADGLQAIAVEQGSIGDHWAKDVQGFIGDQYRELGDAKQALSAYSEMVRFASQPGHRGALIRALALTAYTLVWMGDVSEASAYASRVEALIQEARDSPHPAWRKAYPIFGNAWEAQAAAAQAVIFEARGQYPEAEAAYRRSEAFSRAFKTDTEKKLTNQYQSFVTRMTPEQLVLYICHFRAQTARVEAKQGRLSEAEADARRALLEPLKLVGKYHPSTAFSIVQLAGILVEQGRYGEAEKLARSALDIEHTLGIANDSGLIAGTLWQLGNILVVQRKMQQAAAVYAELDRATAQWTAQSRELFDLNGSRIVALYASGQIEAGVAAAEALVKRQTANIGENSFDAAAARGVLAVGYVQVKRDADAMREFKAAIPIMMEAARENASDDDPTVVAARDIRLQQIIESYIGLVARRNDSNDVAVETFGLADAVRGRSVQKALAASSARMIAKDPALAKLVRTEQDLAKQISAQLGALNNLLALPSDQRAEQNLRDVNAAIIALRADHDRANTEIKQRFPTYSDLINPKPPSVDDIKAALRPGEALRPSISVRTQALCGQYRRKAPPPSRRWRLRRSDSKPKCEDCARRSSP
jgi:tetratricopeptide (TPR) repeat protein